MASSALAMSGRFVVVAPAHRMLKVAPDGARTWDVGGFGGVAHVRTGSFEMAKRQVKLLDKERHRERGAANAMGVSNAEWPRGNRAA